MKKGDIVLIDTNVIIECHRTSCWNALSSFYDIHTVLKVMEETQTGYQNRATQQQIDYTLLKQSIKHIYDVTELDRATQALSGSTSLSNLDPGERDLLTYATMLKGDVWLLCSPDKAAMKAAYNLTWLNRIVSLESLLKACGHRVQLTLKDNYTEAWQSKTKTQIILGT